MGILQTTLGINLTDAQPLIVSPFSNSDDDGGNTPPPGSDFMITETGIYMITETTSSFMITE